LFGHEAYLDKRPQPVSQQTVVALIEIREVVYRVSLRILVVNPHFVMEDSVKTHIAEVRDLFHFAQVATIAVTQREHSPARAEHLFPKMREGAGGCRRVNDDNLRRLRNEGGRKYEQ